MWLNEIFLAILFLCLPLLLGFIRNWVGAVLVSLIFLGIYSAIYWFLNTAEFAKKQEMEYQQEQSISMAIEEYKKNKLDSIENQLSFKNPDESPDRISELAFIQIEQEYPNRKIEKTLKVERPDLFNDRELSLFGKVQNFKFSLFIIVIILVTILSTLLAYTIEYYIRSQNNSTNESFVDGRLFFKYGEYIDSSIIPIGVKESHPNYSDIGGLINKLYEEISIDLDNKFTGDEFYFKDELMVSDAGRKKDSRRFIRLTFTTIRNTSLTWRN